MSSKDDDTMPLPEFSQELTSDITADEDFIPTSQPQSVTSSKTSRNSDSSCNKSEELNPHTAPISNIDGTLPREAIIDKSTSENNKSADFIPDTETKRRKINYTNEDMSCKKKLIEFVPEESFGVEINQTWDVDVSRIPESPASNTQNFSELKESPTKEIPSSEETIKKIEGSITEIIVNDSAETVDLNTTPLKLKKFESGEKLESFSSSDVDRCEETQIFDNSSILLLDQPGPSSLGLENSDNVSSVIEKSYLQATIDDNKENSQDRANGSDLPCSPILVADEFSGQPDSVKKETVIGDKIYQNEVQLKPSGTELTSNSVAIRRVDFKLTVSCLITINTTTNKILQKNIIDVKEIKSKPKSTNIEQPSDNTSEKSKRHSTSSSSSVYSDKTGLPFALPKRLSIVSDQADSSEDDLSVHTKRVKRNHERIPWINEYLLPLAMDDIIYVAFENEDFLKRPALPSPRKPKSKHCNEVNQLKEILENSLSSRTTLVDSAIIESVKVNKFEEKMEASEKTTPEIEKTDDSIKNNVSNEIDTKTMSENEGFDKKQEESTKEPERQATEQIRVEEETKFVSLTNGLPVFARWTDKRYYSGVLSEEARNERWDVKFDDGTLKTIREDFIMPAEWLKVGALAFALVDDKYESGQIIDVKRGKETAYIVELDTNKKEVSVKISDLCLTDVMAGIIREKFEPVTSGTPRGKADIDFDNVLSGKRLREQKTPLKLSRTVGAGSSGLKKKSSRGKKDESQSLKSIKETPQNKSIDLGIRGLKSDNGHLVEDKVISTESPSGNDSLETPFRKTLKESKGKTKPRSLSYDTEDTRTYKGNKWLAPDGTPTPGPSGVKPKTKIERPKPKRQKTKAKAEASEAVEETEQMATRSKKSLTKTPPSCDRSQRKRKLDESVEENIRKKSLNEGNRKVRTRNRKG